ncbi:MAG: hypothetical protein K2O60_06635 [Ruminococcus sp.]|nr:hypothetical protein [Ruminococcus sp.]
MKIFVKSLRIVGAVLSIIFLFIFLFEGMLNMTDNFGKALIYFILVFVSIFVFVACVSEKKNNNLSGTPYELEQIDGYNLAYHYDDVNVCCINAVPIEATLNNKLYLVQDTTNIHDDKAVAIILIPQRRKLGYLYRGKLQDMANDYIRRGDKIKARITYINRSTKQVKMNLSFFKKIK